jgi:hypothetical protein
VRFPAFDRAPNRRRNKSFVRKNAKEGKSQRRFGARKPKQSG